MNTSNQPTRALGSPSVSQQADCADLSHIYKLVSQFIECYGSSGPIIKHINESITAVVHRRMKDRNMDDEDECRELKTFVDAMIHLADTLIDLDAELVEIAMIKKRQAA